MSVLMMAFGGSRWTKEFAIGALRYAVSVGAKLMVIQLLVSVGMGLIQQFTAQFQNTTIADLCVVIGASIVLLALVYELPKLIQGMVVGAHIGSGASALVGAAATAAVAPVIATTGVASAAGSGFAAKGAFDLASAQLEARDAKAGPDAPRRSAIGRSAALTGYAARNMGHAIAWDVGRRLSGQPGAKQGIMTWRMAADLGNRARLLREDQAKPLPASGDNAISPKR